MQAVETTIPDWATETPGENSHSLVMYGWDGDNLQEIQIDRAEYIGLKKHLTTMRGLPAPAAEGGEEADNEAAVPATEPQSALVRIKADLAEFIARTVRGNARGIPGTDSSTILGDLQVLKGIVQDWEAGGFIHDYPNETPLIASMRANLNL